MDGIPWLDDAIGSVFLGPLSKVFDRDGDRAKGIGRGIRQSGLSAWNFVTEDMRKIDTWKGMGKMVGVAYIGYASNLIPGSTMISSPEERLKAFDEQFDTDLMQTHDAIATAISESYDKKIVHGTAVDHAEIIGEIIGAVAGTKGAGAVTNVAVAGGKLMVNSARIAETMNAITKLRQSLKLSTLTDKIKGIVKVGYGIDARIKIVSDFYKKAGYSADEAMKHMEGINFTKAVQTATLTKGTIIQQWVGKHGVGNYFTTLKNGATKNLGIDYTGRRLQQFTLTGDVKVLKSTAADYKGNAGGGTQFFSPEIKDKITLTLPK